MTSVTIPVDRWSRVGRWWRSREWRTAPLWSPAAITAAGVLCVAVMCMSTRAEDLEARYLSEAKSAYQAKEYARAIICYERLAPTAENRPDVLFRMALAAEAAGDRARVAALIQELAPSDRKGYAPAHFWLANQYLAFVPQTPHTLASAEAHLLRALDGELDDRNAAHGLLGSIYLGSNRLDEAEFHLIKAVTTKVEFRLKLALVYKTRGKLAQDRKESQAAGQFFARSRQEAELAARTYGDRVHADPASLRMRLAWADSLAFLEDFPAAIRIVEEGQTLAADPIYPIFLAQVYATWYDVRKKATGVKPAELMSLLDRGLTQDPTNKDLLNRLIDQLRFGGAGAERGRQVLQEMLTKGGTALGLVHFALAVDARVRGDGAAERVHLEQAYRQDPKTGLIANNLAWTLAHAEPPDFPRALDLIDAALSREPSNLSYLDTRARVYMGMGRWQEALADLETVLAKRPEAAGLHPALAEVYDKVGLTAPAAEHRSLEAARKKER